MNLPQLCRMSGLRLPLVKEYVYCREVQPVACSTSPRAELYDAEESLRIMWGDQRAAADKSTLGVYARANGMLTATDLVAFAERLGIDPKTVTNAMKQGRLPIAEVTGNGGRRLYDDSALAVLRVIARERRERNDLAAPRGETPNTIDTHLEVLA